MSPAPSALDHVNWSSLGQRLQQARKLAGHTQQQVAEQLKLARTTLVAIEKGQRRLDAAELLQFAGLYGVDLNELLRDRPATGDLSVQFKTTLQRSAALFDDVAQSELELATALLQKYSENYLELETICAEFMQRLYPAEYSLSGLAIELIADEVAEAERRRLGLSDGPLPNLRAVLETDVGLRIFYLEMDSKIAGLFGCTDELGGCVAINAKHPAERQRFSLAHEYAHFLTERQRPDVQVLRVYDRMPESERFAEAFARRFLMPASGVKRHLRNHLKQKSGPFEVSDLVHLAQYFQVSFEAYVRRVEELGFIAAGTFDKLKLDGFKVRKGQELVGISMGDAAEPKLPPRYQLLAAQAYMREAITEGQLARFLDTDRLGARDLVEHYSGQFTLDLDGTVAWASASGSQDVPVRSR